MGPTVIVAHNFYRSALPSGENTVVRQEMAWLAAAGVTVIPYLRSSDDISLAQKLALPIRPVWSPQGELAQLIKRYRPDVLHLHNPYPLLSPMVVRTAHRLGVPVVQTVHNYRHVCPSALYFRDGAECHDCHGLAFARPAIQHGCYRGSRAQSAIMAATLALHRPTWRSVDRFIAPSTVIVEHLLDYGIPAGRIVIKPNATEDPGPPTDLAPPTQPWLFGPPGPPSPFAASGPKVEAGQGWPAVRGGRGGSAEGPGGVGPVVGAGRDWPAEGALFAGRLDEAKGIRQLLDAWDPAFGVLKVAGDGPLRGLVQGRDGVSWLGNLDTAGVRAAIRGSALVVVPSQVQDVHPTIIIEALANGRAVLGTRKGGIPEMIGPAGWVSDDLARTLPEALSGAQALVGIARQRYLDLYSPAASVKQLITIYEGTNRDT